MSAPGCGLSLSAADFPPYSYNAVFASQNLNSEALEAIHSEALPARLYTCPAFITKLTF